MLLVLITIATLATGTAQQMVQATGTTLFYTRHADSKCASDYYGIKTPSYTTYLSISSPLLINTCLRGSDSTKKITCKMGQNKFTLWETRFAASDAQCATPLTSKPLGMLEHDSLCQPDKKDGGFLKVHCGEDTLAATIAALPALVAPALYPSSKCASAAQLQKKTVLLGKCTPSYEQVSTGGAKVIAHMYKLTTSPTSLRRRLASTLPLGWVTTSLYSDASCTTLSYIESAGYGGCISKTAGGSYKSTPTAESLILTYSTQSYSDADCTTAINNPVVGMAPLGSTCVSNLNGGYFKSTWTTTQPTYSTGLVVAYYYYPSSSVCSTSASSGATFVSYFPTNVCIPRTGGSRKFVTSGTGVTVQVFTDASCATSAATSEAVGLGTCTVNTASGQTDTSRAYVTITTSSSGLSPPSAQTGAPGTLSFVQKKYLKGDLTCSGRVSGQKAIVYPAVPAPASSSVAPTCVADPLFKGRCYLNAPSTAPYA